VDFTIRLSKTSFEYFERREDAQNSTLNFSLQTTVLSAQLRAANYQPIWARQF
jgi:hypothetical protein